MAVPTVGRRNIVIRSQRRHRADGDGLLPDGEVGGAGEAEAGIGHRLAVFERDHHLLEGADQEHPVEEGDDLRLSQAAAQLVLEALLILKRGHLAQGYHARFEGRADVDFLNHMTTPLEVLATST